MSTETPNDIDAVATELVEATGADGFAMARFKILGGTFPFVLLGPRRSPGGLLAEGGVTLHDLPVGLYVFATNQIPVRPLPANAATITPETVAVMQGNFRGGAAHVDTSTTIQTSIIQAVGRAVDEYLARQPGEET